MGKTKIVTVVSHKGGVGKTFTTKSLAEYAAVILKKKVLLIDLDPQTNLSNRFLDMVSAKSLNEEWTPPSHPDFNASEMPQWANFPSSANIWLHGGTYEFKTAIDNLFIVPASSQDLQRIENVSESDVYNKVISIFGEYLNLEEIQNIYDYVFIDTRPSKGPLVRASLNAANYAVMPVELESPSLEGFMGLFSLIKITNSSRKSNDLLKLSAILPNKVKNINLHKDNLEALKNDPIINKFLSPYFKDLVAYKESMAKGGMDILDYPDKRPEKIEYLNVMKYIFQKFGEK